MTDEYSHLAIPFLEFENQILQAIKEADELMKSPVRQETLIDFKEAKDKWVSETQEAFQNSFHEKINWFTSQLKRAKPSTKASYASYWDAFKAYNDEIRMKRYTLSDFLNTISHCESIRDMANSVVKQNLTLVQKASLLLEKLYKIDDENNHLARMLLVGNGVELKRPNEAIEVATYL